MRDLPKAKEVSRFLGYMAVAEPGGLVVDEYAKNGEGKNASTGKQMTGLDALKYLDAGFGKGEYRSLDVERANKYDEAFTHDRHDGEERLVKRVKDMAVAGFVKSQAPKAATRAKGADREM